MFSNKCNITVEWFLINATLPLMSFSKYASGAASKQGQLVVMPMRTFVAISLGNTNVMNQNKILFRTVITDNKYLHCTIHFKMNSNEANKTTQLFTIFILLQTFI